MFNPFFRNETFCGDQHSEAGMTRADGRPRVHLWPRGDLWDRSIGPDGRRMMATSAGRALDLALHELGDRASKGVVVIVEPVP